ncbi:hypothetical protein BD626DRAFT_502759 [Schizophyllum amplum]|uniref:Uncharacterized protein n=1 Tax=Schizophyllum amplum TaxID=97359 RepID=A0A550C8H6_9AGAR|nr:hypothetical protein BD626DRAFT_502759 [Auriculariopsis ampla]
MGFFSTRREDAIDSERASSVVQTIRSRFVLVYPQRTAAETLSGAPTTPSRLHHARSVPTKALFSGSQSAPSSPAPMRKPSRSEMPPPPVPPSARSGAGKENGTSPRKHTDTATLTLAQRLDELRVANAEGLLNDDEYRLLRQNLFERFSSNATVPTEAPVVPVARPTVPGQPVSPRPKSNFVVDRDMTRTPSIRSPSKRSSLSTNMSNMMKFRRSPSTSRDYSETSSVRSFTSNASTTAWPRLKKKTSNSSIATTSSLQPDTASIASSHVTAAHRKGSSTHVPHHLSHFSRDTTRSTGSIRRLANPPSSFNASRVASTDKLPSASFEDVFDESNLQTASDIRAAITSVEAEGRRLMDAFNGLELTALTRAQARGSAVTLTSAPPMPPTPVDIDSVSVRSGASAGTAASRSTRRVARSNLSTGASRPVTLHRKASVSSTGTSGTGGTGGTGRLAPPPMPSFPIGIGQLSGASTSSVNLVRTPMRTVPEDGGGSARPSMEWSATQDPTASAHSEMEDIRRRREEVSARYEARLEYLRAKLKGAVLHEKLLKK